MTKSGSDNTHLLFIYRQVLAIFKVLIELTKGSVMGLFCRPNSERECRDRQSVKMLEAGPNHLLHEWNNIRAAPRRSELFVFRVHQDIEDAQVRKFLGDEDVNT